MEEIRCRGNAVLVRLSGTRLCACVCAYVHAPVCVCVPMCACVSVCVCACVCVCVYGSWEALGVTSPFPDLPRPAQAMGMLSEAQAR